MAAPERKSEVNGNGGNGAEEELLQRAEIREVREIDMDSEEVRQYFNLLRQDSNRVHFVGVPQTLEEFRAELERPEMRALVAVNNFDEAIAFATISDSTPSPEHEHWLQRVVVINDLQNKRRRVNHAGRDFLDRVVDWAFTQPTHDGRERTKLTASVVMGVPNWFRADQMFEHYGFEHRARLYNQVDVIVYGQQRTVSTERFELTRDKWLAERYYRRQAAAGPS